MPLQSQYEMEQAQQGNYLARLKSMFSPTSTAGMVGNQDAYAAHVQQSIDAGQEPLSRLAFQQQQWQAQNRGNSP